MNEQLAIHTIRTLSIDAIEKANSDHPGTVEYGSRPNGIYTVGELYESYS